MKNSASKTVQVSALLLFCVSGYGFETARIQSIPKNEVSMLSLDSRLNPHRIKPHVDDKQAFMLDAESTGKLSVVPVDFRMPDGVTPSFQCGFYLVPEQGPQKYVSVIGDEEVDDCDELQAVGLASDSGSRPRLIFIYQILSPHDDRGTHPYIFSWDAGSGTYVFNQEQSDWVARQKPYRYNISRVRQLLAQHFPAQPQGENHGKPIQ